MPNNIGTVLISAPVVQLKNTQFIKNGAIVPQYLEVPCRATHVDVGQYWATPTKDNGIFTGWWYQPAFTETGDAIAQPSFDSFQVLRVRDKMSDYTWWLKATLAQYTNACNTCCGGDYAPITYTVPVIAPCQQICDAINQAGNYFVVFAAPTLGVGQNYVVNGAFNNVKVNQFTASTLNNLVTALNANFNNVGDSSPGIGITWTANGNSIIGTLAGGQGNGSSLCLNIAAADTSP